MALLSPSVTVKLIVTVDPMTLFSSIFPTMLVVDITGLNSFTSKMLTVNVPVAVLVPSVTLQIKINNEFNNLKLIELTSNAAKSTLLDIFASCTRYMVRFSTKSIVF